MTVLVTGANGFVGSALCRLLTHQGLAVRAVCRNGQAKSVSFSCESVGDINDRTEWRDLLLGVSQVVHLAARVHIMQDCSRDPLADFWQVNVDGTARLARIAAACGVRRFVFISSVKVNGESTVLGQPFTADDDPSPSEPYGVSKYEAEKLLRTIAAETGMEIVIIRPPLVYGPGVKANFESMLRWLRLRVPLPLAAVTTNRRSFVALDNLIDLIATCIWHPGAANQTFLVSDGEDLSTEALLRRMGEALGTPARLFYAPISALRLGAALTGKQKVYQRICGSLQVDIEKAKVLLGWSPIVSVDEGLRCTAVGIST